MARAGERTAAASGERRKALVIEDERDIRELVRVNLEAEGFTVLEAGDGELGLALVKRERPAVVILDLMLPGLGGLEVCRRIRAEEATSRVPVVVLTARSSEADKVVGLEIGADDYIGKPFDPRELRACLKSVMRRLQAHPAATRGDSSGNDARRIPIACCTLDTVSRQLFDRDGREIAITAMEFDLLKVFAAHPNQVLSRDRLLALTCNREWEPFDRSIDIRVARLRRKIEPDPENPQSIRTIRGVGYLYVPPEGEPKPV